MTFNEILKLVLDFLATYHLWVIIGLVALLVLQVIISGCTKGTWKKRYKNLTSSFVEKTNEQKDLKEKNKELVDALTTSTKSLEESHLKNRESLDKIAELESKVADTSIVSEYETKITELRDNLDAVSAKLEAKEIEFDNVCDELEDTLAKTNSQKEEYAAKTSDYEKALNSAKSENEALKYEIESLLSKNEELEFDLKVANDNIKYHMGVNEALTKSIKEVYVTPTVVKRPTKKVKKTVKREKTDDEKLAGLTRAELIKMIERHSESAGTGYKRLSKEKLIELVKYLNSKKRK